MLREHLEEYEEINNVLNHQGLFFVPKSIKTKITNRHYNNCLTRNFGMEKTRERVIYNNYSPTY